MTPSAIQNISLVNEVYNSTMLIKKGFAELQQISGSNDFYHPPILLISSGFERLMKCIICYRHLKVDEEYPPMRVLTDAGHNLDVLLQKIIEICNEFDSYNDRPATRDDLDFIKNNAKLHSIIEILSGFAQGGRYYNLNIVTAGESEFEEPKDKWEELETEIVQDDPELKELMKDLKKTDEMYQRINTILMQYLERFARALSRIFTLGELHSDAGRCYGLINDFLNIMDKDLGRKKY
jgi:hypothetical protein